MIELNLIDWLVNWPPELATLILAMLPIAELRLALPLALAYYKLPLLSAFFWSVLGNMIPVVFILLFLKEVSEWLSRKSALAQKFFSWLFTRTRKKHSQRLEILGSLALVTFVAIPLPITGAWTGALVAFLFGLPFWRSFLLILLGVAIAGLVVSLVSLGLISIF